ncbi:hypothetical protein ESCO_004270 [Escovopsis weberi]|uniref:Uncharacterized protein n=1 Tax=Escovopsis weberi TaxID=150374 RepID=A0A0M9VVC8_ESCWE|nr:hypothetical protein ESCO_004270 [Escovopsis weberi]
MSPPMGHSIHQHMMGASQMRSVPRHPTNGGGMVDLEQAGIDFVLTLERPCMAHLPFLLDRTKDANEGVCGHVLMASCPSVPFDDLTPDVPFKNGQGHDAAGQCPAQGTWEISKADLATLLDLSSRLDLDGEITPVMAWGMVLSHPRAAELLPADFEKLAEDLLSKVRCYGFGAVIEEFELRDAMESLLSDRADAMQC